MDGGTFLISVKNKNPALVLLVFFSLLLSLTCYQENPNTNMGVPKCVAIQDGQQIAIKVNYSITCTCRSHGLGDKWFSLMKLGAVGSHIK